MALFKPKWQHKKARVRLAAVKKIEDQYILSAVALNDSHPVIRQHAVQKITEQTILEDIALHADDAVIRQFAVSNLEDQKVLFQIAKKDRTAAVRIDALKKITDQKLLAYIVEKDKAASVRKAALAGITNPVILSEIAIGCHKVEIWESTVNALISMSGKDDCSVSGYLINTLTAALDNEQEELRMKAAKILKKADLVPESFGAKIKYYIYSRNTSEILTFGAKAIEYLLSLCTEQYLTPAGICKILKKKQAILIDPLINFIDNTGSAQKALIMDILTTMVKTERTLLNKILKANSNIKAVHNDTVRTESRHNDISYSARTHTDCYPGGEDEIHSDTFNGFNFCE